MLKNLINLFYPDLCANCEHILLENENVLCTFCKHDLPIIPIYDLKNNVITNVFYGKLEISMGFALLFFRKEGITQQLMHQLKYKNQEQIGVWLGNWIGEILKTKQEFLEIDCIIPVPLHPKKLRKRGYNQVTKFANQLALHLQKPIITNQLIKTSATKTQTFKDRFERFSDENSKFDLKNPEFFNHKHILILDDVLTTGATLMDCASTFLKAKNCKISVVTMAFTE
ncbi:MAG: ComF family protein [Polaribacter sp.]|nr:ComF family protein [Polaribacter sp.]